MGSENCDLVLLIRYCDLAPLIRNEKKSGASRILQCLVGSLLGTVELFVFCFVLSDDPTSHCEISGLDPSFFSF